MSDPATMPAAGGPDWDAAKAILNEVRHALRHFVATGESTLIDLRAQPFAPGDLERLLAWLGRGEVEARVEALGPTRVWESAVPGVWLVDHRDGDDQRLTLQIEVAEFPEILRSPAQDIEQAVAILDARLGAAADGGP
ncbi:hydrogenase expression/formation protein [Thiococcus pfennigii]|uniref:hydrogenase expression/formation protein n=1 Tax=Thiococcus pfennigii TaxID=1057 RepID=UPI0030B869F1|nr:hydrogenase expression protein HupH [Thiococcus pfennigii]MBK1730916.1 hydrogenase expression protein HupH [Thiococcus pfennigii]